MKEEIPRSSNFKEDNSKEIISGTGQYQL